MKNRAEKRREEREKKDQEKHAKKKWTASAKMINDVVKLKIAPSDIHGVGVFATRNIKKGEQVYASAIPEMHDIPYFSTHFQAIKPEIQQVIKEHFPVVRSGSKFMCPDTLMQMYVNHSDKPNYDAYTDKALKSIKKGEEILEDYKKIPNWTMLFSWLKE
jgi:SET domain-containing protein